MSRLHGSLKYDWLDAGCGRFEARTGGYDLAIIPGWEFRGTTRKEIYEWRVVGPGLHQSGNSYTGVDWHAASDAERALDGYLNSADGRIVEALPILQEVRDLLKKLVEREPPAETETCGHHHFAHWKDDGTATCLNCGRGFYVSSRKLVK